MQISIVKETLDLEARVAASPETVKKYVAMGMDVVVEAGAGTRSSFSDDDYQNAGATIANSFKDAVKSADAVLKVASPSKDELKALKKGANLFAMLNPLGDKDSIPAYAKAGVNAFAMEMIPRITRAQAMDVLSSQANLAGYRAVIDAAHTFGKAMPMMMTAAGTVTPAKVLVLGAGVAGLQAIATAKRLGAVVSAFDVRAAVKEQVESLGAKFVEVEAEEDAETSGGYAKEMSEDYKKRQAAKIKEQVAKSDIVITTALIPGKPAPLLIPTEFVEEMKQGSVILDMAVDMGGNVEPSKPNEIVDHRGVKIIGYGNLASRIAKDASSLLARNFLNLMKLIYDEESKSIKLDLEDEIVKAALLTQDGAVIHDAFTETKGE